MKHIILSWVVVVTLVIIGITLVLLPGRIRDRVPVLEPTPLPSPMPTPLPNKVSFTIGGDMMLGRKVAYDYLHKGLPTVLDQLGLSVFADVDAAIVNLEGPISATPVPFDIRPNNLVFNFPPETISALQYLGVNAVSLANNHTANQGRKGIETTLALLKAANIQAIGGPSSSYVEKIGTFRGQGLTLYVIGVHLLAETPDITPLIRQLKQDPKSRILVFPHWGAEYITHHGTSQERLARAWIDAGADIVIGGHPHVVQDAEVYKGKPIFYSLGNLLFDQAFSPEVQRGLIITGTFMENGLMIKAMPTQSTKYKPALVTGALKEQTLSKLYAPLLSIAQPQEDGALFFPQP